jgi:uncharacterized protein YkwD
VSRAAFERTNERTAFHPAAPYQPYPADYPPDYPPEPPPGRRRGIDRVPGGIVGIAAVIGALLFMFGVGVAIASILRSSETPTGQAATDAPTPVDAPSEPVIPSADTSPAASPSRSARPSAAALSVNGNGRVEGAVVSLVNRERERAGCRQKLKQDGNLRDAARGHSADMASREFFSHTGSDGSNANDRMRRAGFDRPLSENLARGPRSAQDVVRAWMSSPEQRANILDCDARAVGVGVAVRAGGGEPYWTQDFGR